MRQHVSSRPSSAAIVSRRTLSQRTRSKVGDYTQDVWEAERGKGVLVSGVVRWIGRGESANYKNRPFASAPSPSTQSCLTGRTELTRDCNERGRGLAREWDAG